MTPFPLTRDQARDHIRRHHRHHGFPAGFKFAIGAQKEERLVGIVLVGRPVSRELQKRELLTCEATRVCTDGTRNACSFLYARARRCAFEMGFTRIITYILASESGTSLKAAGWRFVRITRGGKWDRPSRRRLKKAPEGPKQLWEARA